MAVTFIRAMLLYYLLIVNVLTFLVYGLDKQKARHKRWRVPESTLMGMAALGGSIGAWLAMRLFHHKTQHKKFRYGVPLMLVAQIALILIGLYLMEQRVNNL